MSNAIRETKHDSALWQLVSVRFKEYTREPEALFWSFGFPILLAIGLGIAFRSKPADVVHVAVVDNGARSAPVAGWLRSDSGLAVERLLSDSAEASLRTGRVALLVIPDSAGGVRYEFDDTRPDARTARFMVNDAVQRGAGRGDVLASSDQHVRERGSRYIDFVVPGLLGMTIMGGGIWGIGFSIVDQRRKKLLKRLIATPMSRASYLASYIISRLVLLTIEVVVLLGFSLALFGVPMRGSPLAIVAIIVLSALAFGGFGLLLASRSQTIEGVSGLMNLSMLPMWVLSGVFFSSENFPRVIQPVIKALPLTATNDALRANMLRGVPLTALAPQIGVLVVWMIVCFAAALKIFRWR
ncbi:MAG TPA: ABC transporter permease [Gemmatimonadaceae bacterium]|jgi:ABC-type multidrug transport system permease subunit|nr:ABC transporter permease [Gemmatimonadaceae bacterium]